MSRHHRSHTALRPSLLALTLAMAWSGHVLAERSDRSLSLRNLDAPRIDWRLAAASEAVTDPVAMAAQHSLDADGRTELAPPLSVAQVRGLGLPSGGDVGSEVPTASADLIPVAAPSSSRWKNSASRTIQHITGSLKGWWTVMQDRLLPGGSPSTNAEIGQMAEATRSRHQSANAQLTDYAVEGGFRASAGLVRTDADSWWRSRQDRATLGASYDRLQAAGLLSGASSSLPDSGGSYPYLGAGYSSRLIYKGSPSLLRVNADLGVMSMNSTTSARAGDALSGDRSLDDVMRDMRLRPKIKVSVGYSF